MLITIDEVMITLAIKSCLWDLAQTLKNPPAMRGPGFNPWVGKISLEEGMATHSSISLENPHRQRTLAYCSPWGRKELE